MNYTKIHMVTLVAGICFAQGALRATEQPRPNKFKVLAAAAAVTLGVIVGKETTSADTARYFAHGATVCGSAALGSSAGVYASSYATNDNSVGVTVGSIFGSGLALTPAVVSGVIDELIKPSTTLNSVAGVIGCCCGGAVSFTGVNAVLQQ